MSDSTSILDSPTIPTQPVAPASPQPEAAGQAPAQKKRGGLIAVVAISGVLLLLAAFGGGVALGMNLDNGFGGAQNTNGQFVPGEGGLPGDGEFPDRGPGMGDRPGGPGDQNGDQSGDQVESDS